MTKICCRVACRPLARVVHNMTALVVESPVPEFNVAYINNDMPVTPSPSTPTQKQPVDSCNDVRNPMIAPKFWTGEPSLAPVVYEIDCSAYDMTLGLEHPENASLVQEMLDRYEKIGLIHLRNTRLTDLQVMRSWANRIVEGDDSDYKGGANSRGPIENNVYDTGAPKEAFLHYHHEMAYLKRSVGTVAFCSSASIDDGTTRGAMFVSDSVRASEDLLSTPFGQRLKEKGITYIRCLTDREAYKHVPKGWNGLDEVGVYNHWQRSFGVETPEEVEVFAKEKGLSTQWGPNRYLKTKFRTDVFEYFPALDKNILYASVADDSMWHDNWPGVQQLPTQENYEDATMFERPLKITYGDDTEFTREELLQFVDVYDKYGLPLNWKNGDVAVMCNWRWVHGRPSYHLEEDEERTLGVVLGKVFDRRGQHEGKW